MMRFFSEIGLQYTFGAIADHDIEWFSFPLEWRGFATVEAAGAIYVFDNDGNLTGVG